MNRVLLLILSLLIAGCVSDQERAESTTTSDDATCQDYGASPGTTEYFQCRMAKDQQRQATRAALAGAILNKMAY